MSEPIDNEFPTIDDVYKRMDELAREIATMSGDEPRWHHLISELQRLNFVVESMKRAKP